jgi:hypothetical protein
MNSKKFNFNFPSTVLEEKDFFPIETFIFKEYYRVSFLDLIDKVIKIIYYITLFTR